MAKKELKHINVKQIRSLIGCTKKQIACIKGLGLRKIHHTVTIKDTPENRGMIKVINHMVEINI